LRHCALHTRLRADVERERNRTCPEAFELGDDLFERRLRELGDREIVAVASEPQCDRRTEPLRCAGDERDAAPPGFRDQDSSSCFDRCSRKPPVAGGFCFYFTIGDKTEERS
jgi:hypothetical protein